MKTETNLQDIQINLTSDKLQTGTLKAKSLRPTKSVMRAKSLRPDKAQTAVVAKMRRSQVKLS